MAEISRFSLVILCFCLGACAEDPPKTLPSPNTSAMVAWRVPATFPAEQGPLIQRGQELITNTAQHLGPDVKNPTKRFAGNRLTCQNCHLKAGQQPDAVGFVGITHRFPQYRPRENRPVSLIERINGCFERSLNGKAVSPDSPEMKAMLAYMAWLSQEIPRNTQVKGQGLPKISLLNRAADPSKGKQIFHTQCAQCHQPNGQGIRQGTGYRYPPLWGPDSFNTGAGMYRVLIAARYIKSNMPLGNPHLTDAEAFDVAAFINSQPRPIKPHLEQDFPDRSRKPVDAPFPPWADGYSPAQHKYGPFGPMMKGRTE